MDNRQQDGGAPHSLSAGVAQVEITPPPGTHLAGGINVFRPAQKVVDPLYAKALVLQAGGRKLCFVSLDLVLVVRGYTERIRQAAAQRCGLEAEAVMVHATQTHSAPSLGYVMLDEDFGPIPSEAEWLRGAQIEYCEFALERIIQAIVEANDNLQPAQVGAASGIEGRMAFNRRAILRDGTALRWLPFRPDENPLGPVHILQVEGPIDPELGVLGIRNAQGFMAMLLSYTCHPMNVFARHGEMAVSAEWCGALADEMRQTYGSACIPLVLNGACGNIGPFPAFDTGYPLDPTDHRAMGRVLAETARKVITSLSFEDDITLDWKTQMVRLPLRAADPAQLAADRQMIQDHPQPPWADEERTSVREDWMLAASRLSAHLQQQREGDIDYEIQVLRVGKVAFVGLPGEPFVEGGLRIKEASPFYPTYIVHCVTQYVGYLPVREAFARGGHEVDYAYWAKVEPGCLETVVQNAITLLHELKER